MTSVKPQKAPGRKKGQGAPSDDAVNGYTLHRLRELEASEKGDWNDVYRQGGLGKGTFTKLKTEGRGVGLNSLADLARFFGFEHRWQFLRAADEWHAEQLAKNPRTLAKLAGWDDASRTLTALDDVPESDIELLGETVATNVGEPLTVADLRRVLRLLRKH